MDRPPLMPEKVAHREEGAILAEYAFLLSLVVVVTVAAITVLGLAISSLYRGFGALY